MTILLFGLAAIAIAVTFIYMLDACFGARSTESNSDGLKAPVSASISFGLAEAQRVSKPFEPEPSVSAAEFLRQLKAERAERKTEKPIVSVEPEKPEAPKKTSKAFISFVLCAIFALGTIAGSIGGSVASSRYQLVDSGGDLYRIDRLTSKVWLVDDLEVYPVEEKDRP